MKRQIEKNNNTTTTQRTIALMGFAITSYAAA